MQENNSCNSIKITYFNNGVTASIYIRIFIELLKISDYYLVLQFVHLKH